MKIAQFSKQTGLSKDTIRYYEKINLIQPVMKQKHRDYSEDDKQTIETIIKLKDTGFTLQEIKLLFDWSKDADPERELTEAEYDNILQIKDLFQVKYEEMEQKEKRIKEMKRVLLNADGKLESLLRKNSRWK